MNRFPLIRKLYPEHVCAYAIRSTPAARAGEFADDSRFPCDAFRAVDVAASSDNMGPARAAKGGAAYAAGGTLNSGILFFRATPAGKRFASAWHANVQSPPTFSRFRQMTSDQQVLNGMVRKERQWPGLSANWGATTMKSFHPEWMKANLTLGALPLPLFANGHGYFVQRAHRKLGLQPFAVHATYSLDAHGADPLQDARGQLGCQRGAVESRFRGGPPAILVYRLLRWQPTQHPTHC